MSVIAALKTPDGIILAADSAAHIYQDMGKAGHKRVKVFGNAQNLFRVKDLKIGILTYGLGNLGNRSVGALVNEFIRTKGVNFTEIITVQDIAQSLFYTLKEKYDQYFGVVPVNERPALGFIVAGFQKNDLLVQEFEFTLPRAVGVKRIKEATVFGFECRGITNPFERLHKGYDKELMAGLAAKLEINPTVIDEVAGKYESPVLFNAMPLAEAVEYVEHVILTTINHTRFELGEAPCHQPIDIAVITRDRYMEVQVKPIT